MQDQLTKNIAALRDMKANGWSIDLLLELAFGEEGFSCYRDGDEKTFMLALYREHLAKAERAAARGTDPSETGGFTSGWLIDEIMCAHPSFSRDQAITIIKVAGCEVGAGGF